MPSKSPQLVEVAPGRWRIAKVRSEPARSHLGFPVVISDEMPPTEQVDGKYYTSKAKFRAVGRELGLTEVGNDPARLAPKKQRSTSLSQTKARRREVLERAVAQYWQGRRARSRQHAE